MAKKLTERDKTSFIPAARRLVENSRIGAGLDLTSFGIENTATNKLKVALMGIDIIADKHTGNLRRSLDNDAMFNLAKIDTEIKRGQSKLKLLIGCGHQIIYDQIVKISNNK